MTRGGDHSRRASPARGTGRPPPATARGRHATRAAERLIDRHGDALLATARRYTASPEDAEDAYQRGLEILLTRTPDLAEDELLPWMKTVIKHEAFAIWRGRDRAIPPSDDEPLEHAASAAPSPAEQVESYERLRLGAEAIGRLKPQEVRCLLLRAEGYSYRQICQVTGWTYTKVNRCLTEGRQSFLRRVAGIESGAECDRLAPLLSALADGEATSGDMSALRPHLRACLACRATLRAYREVPHRAAELVPLTGAAGSGDGPATLWRWIDSAVAWAQERVALIGAKAQAAAEAASAGKVAAVAASTVALAGGTVAVRSLEGDAVGEPRLGPDRSESVLQRAAPPNLLPRLPDEALPAEADAVPVPEPESVPTELASAPPVQPAPPTAPSPAAPPPGPPAPMPVEPAVDEGSTYVPPPPSLSRNVTVPVTNPGSESALADVDEDERDIEPMTTPLDRRAGRAAPAAPAQE